MGRRSHVNTRCWFSALIVWFPHNLLNGPGIWWSHGNRNGGLVLKIDANWRNINGILIRTRNTQTFIHFRRRPKYMISVMK